MNISQIIFAAANNGVGISLTPEQVKELNQLIKNACDVVVNDVCGGGNAK